MVYKGFSASRDSTKSLLEMKPSRLEQIPLLEGWFFVLTTLTSCTSPVLLPCKLRGLRKQL